jgi:predicted ATP-dependent endonuclease of OLD family
VRESPLFVTEKAVLLEFRVSNYRSIDREQVLSLVASSDKSMLGENCAPTGLSILPHALRSLAIYGPNASGKSNIVKALSFFKSVVGRSAQGMTEGDAFKVEPFLFVDDPPARPTEMELTFVEAGVRYQYGFNLSHQRVREEWLVVYRSRKPQQWFERRFDEALQQDVYTFGSYLAGERKLWQRSTRGNALFLSTAVLLNSEQLRPIFQWITEKLRVYAELPRAAQFLATNVSTTVDLIEKPESRDAVIALLNQADFGIQSAKSQRAPLSEDLQQKIDLLVPTELRSGWNLESVEVELEHEAVLESGERIRGSISIEDESLGTQQFFGLAAPFLRALEGNHVLVVDELDRSLHPLLTRFLVSRFHGRQSDGGGAGQLIFTTHTTSLLDPKLLRRDQILLVEKGRDLASVFYPLTDFHARKGAPLEKSYLEGRMGAIPVL